MRTSGQNPDVGAISNLTYGLPLVSSIKGYIETLKTKTALRKVIKFCAMTEARAIDNEGVEEILLDMESTAQEIRRRAGIAAKGFRDMREVQRESEVIFERLHRGESNAIPTGFQHLDS